MVTEGQRIEKKGRARKAGPRKKTMKKARWVSSGLFRAAPQAEDFSFPTSRFFAALFCVTQEKSAQSGAKKLCLEAVVFCVALPKEGGLYAAYRGGTAACCCRNDLHGAVRSEAAAIHIRDRASDRYLEGLKKSRQPQNHAAASPSESNR